jgi:hypothetical protein
MRKTWNKYAAVGLIISFFALFHIQSSLPFLEVAPLKGDVNLAKDTVFTWKTWGNESYQKKKENYLNENFGFREIFVRLHNQLYFSLFNTAFANGVIVGKQNYLYEINYINALTGKDLVSDEVIKSKVDSFVFVKNTLDRLGVKFLVVFAPSKGRFYPEFIPEKFGKPSSATNYSKYKEQIEKSGLDFIDFNKWFCDMKNTAQYPLFPKTGIHWSEYGVALATDSLVGFIENTYHVDLPGRKLDQLNLGYSGGNDRDIEEGANLLFGIDVPQMAYPTFKYWEKRESDYSVLTIGDSFYWQIFGNEAAAHFFKEPEFYYYFEVAYYHKIPEKDLQNVNIAEEIKKQKLVIFLITEANLPKLDWGFSKRVLFDLNISDEEYNKLVEDKINSILHTPEWLAYIKKKAEEKKMDFEKVLREDAEYVANEELKNRNK